MNGAANRDPRRFEEPDEFRLGTPKHIATHGIRPWYSHVSGRPIARAEVRVKLWNESLTGWPTFGFQRPSTVRQALVGSNGTAPFCSGASTNCTSSSLRFSSRSIAKPTPATEPTTVEKGRRLTVRVTETAPQSESGRADCSRRQPMMDYPCDPRSGRCAQCARRASRRPRSTGRWTRASTGCGNPVDWVELLDPPTRWGWISIAYVLIGALPHSGRWRRLVGRVDLSAASGRGPGCGYPEAGRAEQAVAF